MHSSQIWFHLHQQFNTVSLTRAINLKRMLISLHKTKTQSMDDCLRSIKLIVDSIASINSPISDMNLLQYTIASLPVAYEEILTEVGRLTKKFPQIGRMKEK